MSEVPNELAIRAMFNAGDSYNDIAGKLGVTKGIVAGRCRRLGLVRENSRQAGIPRGQPKRLSAEERAEREEDQRDLDILYDLKDGHTQHDVARHWGVSKTRVHLLERARKEAN